MPENNTQTQNYKTVFILGAGASYDFGFPTGEELLRDVDEVCNAIEDDMRGERADNDFESLNFSLWRAIYHHDADVLCKHAQRLRNGLPLSKSIDNFLNDQQDEEFQNFGKMVIALALLMAERRGLAEVDDKPRRELIPWRRFHANQPPDFFELRDTWFTTFFRELRTDNGKPDQGIEAFKNRLRQIAVITFNYERSFEYLMREAIKQYQMGITEEAVDEIMSCLKIIHPYGDLGELSELPFGAHPKTIEDWSVFQERIQIFMEQADGKTQAEAQKVIQSAEKRVFLGFGFHEQNMEFLGLGDRNLVLGKNPKKYATALGLSDYRKSKLEERLQYKRQMQDGMFLEGSMPHIEQTTCEDILSEYADDIFNFD